MFPKKPNRNVSETFKKKPERNVSKETEKKCFRNVSQRFGVERNLETSKKPKRNISETFLSGLVPVGVCHDSVIYAPVNIKPKGQVVMCEILIKGFK